VDGGRVGTCGCGGGGTGIVWTSPLVPERGGSGIAGLRDLGSRAVAALHRRAVAREGARVVAALGQGGILAGHLVTDGGALAAIAKMAFASDTGLGFRIDPQPVAERAGHDLAWFAEMPAFVVEVADNALFAKLSARHGVAAYDAGEVIAEPAAIIGNERISLAELREGWEAPLRDFYGSLFSRPSTGSG